MMKYEFNKRNLYIVILLTITIFYFFMRKEFNTILLHVTQSNPWWLLLGVVCIVIYWLVEARTLHIMIRAYDPSFSYLKIAKLIISTQFFNGITPFATGGQPFQIYVLNKRSQLTLSSITSASLQNFIVYQTVLVIFGIIAIIARSLFNVFTQNIGNMNTFILLGFGMNAAVIILLLLLCFSQTFTHFISHTVLSLLGKTPLIKDVDKARQKLSKTVNQFHVDINVLWKDKKLMVHAIILNSFKLLAFYAIAYFIVRAVGFQHINLIQAVVASAYVMLLTSIVPIPGASGGAEFGFLMFFGSFVVGPSATAIMLLWRFITYYVGLITGFCVFTFAYSK